MHMRKCRFLGVVRTRLVHRGSSRLQHRRAHSPHLGRAEQGREAALAGGPGRCRRCCWRREATTTPFASGRRHPATAPGRSSTQTRRSAGAPAKVCLARRTQPLPPPARRRSISSRSRPTSRCHASTATRHAPPPRAAPAQPTARRLCPLPAANRGGGQPVGAALRHTVGRGDQLRRTHEQRDVRRLSAGWQVDVHRLGGLHDQGVGRARARLPARVRLRLPAQLGRAAPQPVRARCRRLPRRTVPRPPARPLTPARAPAAAGESSSLGTATATFGSGTSR